MTKFADKYPNQPVRALSWKQPYASLMLHGKIETRTWDTKYRGWVLICASKASYSIKDIVNISGRMQFERIKGTFSLFEYMTAKGSTLHYMDITPSHVLNNGKAIAIGRLINSRRMGSIVSDRTITDQGLYIESKCFVAINYDLFLHEYSDVQAIEPFDWHGTQGWKKLDEETIDKIKLI